MTALPIHPRTGLTAAGIVNGRPVWPILGASEPPPADTPPPAPPAYTPPTSQADLDRLVEDRLARERKKYGATPDEVANWRDAAGRLQALELELASETEKATRQAADQSWTAAMSQAVPRVVRAEFRAEAKGVLTNDQLAALLEDLDLTRYADDDGEPDSEKIAAKVAAFAPQQQGPHMVRPPINLGQGQQPPSHTKAGDQGRAMAEKRFKKTGS